MVGGTFTGSLSADVATEGECEGVVVAAGLVSAAVSCVPSSAGIGKPRCSANALRSGMVIFMGCDLGGVAGSIFAVATGAGFSRSGEGSTAASALKRLRRC